MGKFELRVAWRHLITGHGQTELTVGAVAVGVLLVVFLSSLINGLQVGLIEDVVGSIPHVTLEAAPSSAKPLWQVRKQDGRVQVVTHLERISQQKHTIEDWPKLEATIRTLPGVRAVAPSVTGSGYAGRGARKVGAVVQGVIPAQQMRVTSLRSHIVEGDFSKVDQQNAAIGIRMADDLGVGIGDRIHVTSDEGLTQDFRVAAIFDLGVENANQSWVYVGLSAAQAMFRIGKDVTTIGIRTADIMKADAIAEEVRGFTNLKVSSWMQDNEAFLESLTMQKSASLIVQGMTLLASAFGVASVMIVFVVQKSRDIGILKSMGTTSKQIRRIFLLEGLGVGLGGALLGSGLGTGLCFFVSNIMIPGQTFGGKPATLVPMQWDGTYVVWASLVAILMGLLSSVVPAHRASKLNPVEAIRRGL